MNLSEFRAWFEGFTENLDGPPNERQWKKIQKKVEGITSDPTPWPVFVDRYIQPYRPHWQWPYWQSHTIGAGMGTVTGQLAQQPGNMTSNVAFAELGRIEHQEMN